MHVQELANVCHVDPIIADILMDRGMDEVVRAQDFLYGRTHLFHDPLSMQDMDRAVSRIWRAVEHGENILIVGDSDADGITATAVLLQYLRSIGAKVKYHIPANDTIQQFWHGEQADILHGVDLIITVDTGISAVSGGAFPNSIDIVVTDHHECKKQLPAAYAVIDPKRSDDAYPFPSLSGAGVALKVVCAMAARNGDPQAEFERYCDMVAIGTVADAMPLIDENRYIVKQGLMRMQKRQRMGVDMLLRSAGYNFNRPITASGTGFVIAPRLNAAGRIGRSDLAVELLCTDNHAQARTLAEKLSQFNRERQQMESVAVETASAIVEKEIDWEKEPLILLRVEDWPTGIPGIVASRLVDRYAVPCIIVSFTDGIGRGSGRSIKGFDIFSAIQDCASCLTEFGGHELAAGFTVEEAGFGEFKKRMLRQADENRLRDGRRPMLPIVGELSASQVTMELARQLQLLEPFGMENPQPLFVTKEVLLDELMPLANTRHMRFSLKKDGRTFTGLMFGHSLRELRCTAGDLVDIVYALDINVGKSGEHLQLIVKKIEVSQCCLTPGYEAEYERFMAGDSDDLPEQAVPDRKDIIDVYSYLLRTMGEADVSVPRYQTVMARRISRAFGKPFNYSQLMLSLQVLCELKMVELSSVGKQIQVRVNCCNEKKNLTQSALWRRLKG